MLLYLELWITCIDSIDSKIIQCDLYSARDQYLISDIFFRSPSEFLTPSSFSSGDSDERQVLASNSDELINSLDERGWLDVALSA